jgi:hypothetical protein
MLSQTEGEESAARNEIARKRRKLTRPEERLLVQTVTQNGKSDVSEPSEHDDHRNEDSEGVEIVFVEQAIKITRQEIVKQRYDPGGSDGVIGTDITADGDLLRQVDAGEQEFPEEGGNGTSSGPVPQRVEEKFITTVRILLPTRQLVIDGQRDAFLESIACIRGEAAAITSTLKSKRHVEVFGHVGFGPELLVAVFIVRSRVLNSSPAQDSVVTDERN